MHISFYPSSRISNRDTCNEQRPMDWWQILKSQSYWRSIVMGTSFSSIVSLYWQSSKNCWVGLWSSKDRLIIIWSRDGFGWLSCCLVFLTTSTRHWQHPSLAYCRRIFTWSVLKICLKLKYDGMTILFRFISQLPSERCLRLASGLCPGQRATDPEFTDCSWRIIFFIRVQFSNPTEMGTKWCF